MRKIFLCMMLVLLCLAPLCLPQNSFAEGESTFVVTANEAVVYAEPTLSAEHKLVLKHKDEIELECENEIVKTFAGDGFVFFHVVTAEKEGFVISDLVIKKEKFLTTFPKFNAKTNSKAKVYFLQDGKYVESGITLPKHQRIFLYEGFNGKKKYNAIAFVHENEVVYGFLKESVIDPDGINPILVTVICFAIAAIGIILAFVFIKKKKKRTGVSRRKNR